MPLTLRWFRLWFRSRARGATRKQADGDRQRIGINRPGCSQAASFYSALPLQPGKRRGSREVNQYRACGSRDVRRGAAGQGAALRRVRSNAAEEGAKARYGHAGVVDRERKQRNGFDYVYSVADDHSRLAYSEILPDERGITCAEFLNRAAAYFRDRGIDHIERVMTDNAWAYRYSLREVCATLGARQAFIKPHCPGQEGKVAEVRHRASIAGASDERSPNGPNRTSELSFAGAY